MPAICCMNSYAAVGVNIVESMLLCGVCSSVCPKYVPNLTNISNRQYEDVCPEFKLGILTAWFPNWEVFKRTPPDKQKSYSQAMKNSLWVSRHMQFAFLKYVCEILQSFAFQVSN